MLREQRRSRKMILENCKKKIAWESLRASLGLENNSVFKLTPLYRFLKRFQWFFSSERAVLNPQKIVMKMDVLS